MYGGGGIVPGRVEFSEPRCLGLASLRCGHCRVAELDDLGPSDLAFFAAGQPALGFTACGGRRHPRRLVVDRPQSLGTADLEQHGARVRSAGPRLASLQRAGHGPTVGVGCTERLSRALERLEKSAGGEPRLTPVRHLRVFVAAGHPPTRRVSSTPWGIFPRA